MNNSGIPSEFERAAEAAAATDDIADEMRLPSADGSGSRHGSATREELAEQFGVSSSTLDRVSTITTTDTKVSVFTKAEYVTLIPPVSTQDYERLKMAIKEQNGLLMPIIINQENVVLDGHHRLRA